MLRRFTQAVCDAILLQSYSTAVHPPESDPRTRSTRGFTSDIPFSPLKIKVTMRVTAAQTDFAEVDFDCLVLPSRDRGGGPHMSCTSEVCSLMVGNSPREGCNEVVAIKCLQPQGLGCN